MLSIYGELQRICKKHNLRCFAIGGTALGTIRHKGFIPWDDDMDFGMPVEDYNKFIKLCKKELQKPFKFTEIPIMGGKIHDTSTTFLETVCMKYSDNHYGIFVDIFPLMGVPDNLEKRRLFLQEVEDYKIDAETWYHYRDKRFSEKNIKQRKNRLLNAYSIQKTKRMIWFSLGHCFTLDTSGIKNPIELPFEDTSVLISSKYHEDLTSQYGDYMKLPPKSERVNHSIYSIVKLDSPYKDFIRKLQTIDPEIKDFIDKKHTREGVFFYNMFVFLKQKDKLLREHEDLRKELESIKNSRLFKLGKVLLAPVYKVKKILKK